MSLHTFWRAASTTVEGCELFEQLQINYEERVQMRTVPSKASDGVLTGKTRLFAGDLEVGNWLVLK